MPEWTLPTILGTTVAGLVIQAVAAAIIEYRFRLIFRLRRQLASRRKRGAAVSVTYRYGVGSHAAEVHEWFRHELGPQPGFSLVSGDSKSFAFLLQGQLTRISPDHLLEEVNVTLESFQDYWRNLPDKVGSHARQIKHVLTGQLPDAKLVSVQVEVKAPYLVEVPQSLLGQLEVEGVFIEMNHKATATSVKIGRDSARFVADEVGTTIAVLRALL